MHWRKLLIPYLWPFATTQSGNHDSPIQELIWFYPNDFCMFACYLFCYSRHPQLIFLCRNQSLHRVHFIKSGYLPPQHKLISVPQWFYVSPLYQILLLLSEPTELSEDCSTVCIIWSLNSPPL